MAKPSGLGVPASELLRLSIIIWECCLLGIVYPLDLLYSSFIPSFLLTWGSDLASCRAQPYPYHYRYRRFSPTWSLDPGCSPPLQFGFQTDRCPLGFRDTSDNCRREPACSHRAGVSRVRDG
jgi:hypothetical protein